MIGPSRQERIDGRGFDAYWDFRDQLAGDLRARKVRPTAETIIDHATREYGLDAGDAAAWTERFLDGIRRDLERRAGQYHPSNPDDRSRARADLLR
jgi:hypothetical protein